MWCVAAGWACAIAAVALPKTAGFAVAVYELSVAAAALFGAAVGLMARGGGEPGGDGERGRSWR